MAITLDGTTGVTAAEFDGALDASNLTGTLPAPTTSAVLAATSGASAGAVGTYILGKTNTTVSFGSNYSSVYASSAYGSYNQLVSGT